MDYYLGNGMVLDRKTCKKYKTLDGALKAAAKGEKFVVWDENGKVIESLTYNVPKGDTETGENRQEEEQVINAPHKEETGVIEANSEPEDAKTIIPQGTMRVMVVCDGTLNLRRTTASWIHGNECGRAARGQSYYVKAIHTVNGKKMVETVDGIFLSGQSEHVQFEQL